MSKKPDEAKLRDYFLKKLRLGNILTNKELRAYARQRKLAVSLKYIHDLRDNILPTLLYKTPVNIKVYQTITVDRLGLLSMDFANFHPEWASFNSGFKGFLMVNSVIAQKHLAIPMKTHKIWEFERALEEICRGDTFPVVSVILSDRETSITSPSFRKKMFEKYGIRFKFITRYNKAWASENAINHTKRNLSIVLRLNQGKKWIDLLPEITNSHNRRKIEGTSFSPNEITKENFLEFINELHDSRDMTMRFSTTSIDSRSFQQKAWIKRLFKFKLGQRVFASKYSLHGRKAFGKQSMDGTYSDIPFLIKRAKLRQTKDDTLVPGIFSLAPHMFFHTNFFLYLQCINYLTWTPNALKLDTFTHLNWSPHLKSEYVNAKIAMVEKQ